MKQKKNMSIKFTKDQIKQYLEALEENKEEGLYKKTIGQGLLAMASTPNVDIIILDHSDAFFEQFRKTNNEKLFILGKIFRRAAHVFHRELIKQNKSKPDSRFLSAVK